MPWFRNKTGLHYLLFLAVFKVAGCSVNETGFVSLERIEADGAMVYRARAPGIHIDTRDQQPSLTIGTYEVTHIFPLECGGVRTAALKNAALFAALDPQLSSSRIAGLQVKSGPGETSFTLGMREHTRLISLDRERETHRVLEYRSKRPAETILRTDSKYSCSKT